MSGNAERGTPNSSHNSSSQSPVARLYNNVRLALLASVTCDTPRVSRAIMYESTVPAAVRPAAIPDHTRGSLSCTHVSLVAVK